MWNGWGVRVEVGSCIKTAEVSLAGGGRGGLRAREDLGEECNLNSVAL